MFGQVPRLCSFPLAGPCCIIERPNQVGFGKKAQHNSKHDNFCGFRRGGRRVCLKPSLWLWAWTQHEQKHPICNGKFEMGKFLPGNCPYFFNRYDPFHLELGEIWNFNFEAWWSISWGNICRYTIHWRRKEPYNLTQSFLSRHFGAEKLTWMFQVISLSGILSAKWIELGWVWWVSTRCAFPVISRKK